MKKIFFILSLLISVVSYGQLPGYTTVNDRYVHEGLAPKGLLLPAYGDTVFRTGQSRRAGSIIVDTTGANKGVYIFYDNYWHLQGSGTVDLSLYTLRTELQDTAADIRSTIAAMGGGGRLGKEDTLQAENRYVNMASYNFKWKNGSHHIASADSLGNRLNYSWASNPLDAGVWSSSGTAPTTGGVSTTINGSNTLTSVIKTGAENFTFRFTAITNAKSNTVQTVSALVKPDTLSAVTTRKISWLLADTAGWIGTFRNDGATAPLASNRGYQQLLWASSDTFDFEFINRARYILATMTNRANGQRSYFRYDINAAIGNVGVIQLITSGNFTFLGNFQYKIDEIRNPDFIIVGNSTVEGSGANGVPPRWVNKLFERTSNTWAVHAGGGERAVSLLGREEEITEFYRPRYVIMDYGVNDLNGGSIGLFAQYCRRFADSLNAEGIGHIWLSLVPQASNVATFNDTIQAIATAKGGRYINQTTVLQAGSADFNKNALYKPPSDAIHVNDVGQQIQADVIYDGLVGLIEDTKPVVIDQIPTSNKYSTILARDENNQLIGLAPGFDTSYIRNDPRQAGEAIGSAQTGGFFLNGDGTLGSLSVIGNGTVAAPAFATTSAGATTATNFTTNNMASSGGVTTFSSNYINFTNGTYMRALASTPLKIMVNISSPTAGSRGIRVGSESSTPGQQFLPLVVEVSDSIKARFTRNGGLVINDQGDVGGADLRVEGDTDSTLLYTDATNDRVGIGIGTPREKADINGILSLRNVPAGTSTDSLMTMEDGRVKSINLTSLNTDYFYLPGRAGGQIANGGNAANDVLTLRGNSATSSNTPGNTSIQFRVGDSKYVSMLLDNQGVVKLNGGTAHKQTSISTNSTVTTFDHTVFVDATSGNVTITLPPYTTATGIEYVIKKTDGSVNTVTIDGDGSETIDGAATKVINLQYRGTVLPHRPQVVGTLWDLFKL